MTGTGGSAMLPPGQNDWGAGMKRINGVWGLDTLDALAAPPVDARNGFRHGDGRFARAGYHDDYVVVARGGVGSPNRVRHDGRKVPQVWRAAAAATERAAS